MEIVNKNAIAHLYVVMFAKKTAANNARDVKKNAKLNVLTLSVNNYVKKFAQNAQSHVKMSVSTANVQENAMNLVIRNYAINDAKKL